MSLQPKRAPRGEPARGPAVEHRILTHLAFARAVARRTLSPRCSGEDREDLVAWGVVGLVQAAQRYREGGRATFAAFAAPRVRGQVLDALRAADPLPRAARRAWRAAAREGNPFPILSLDRQLERGRETFRPLHLAAAAPSVRDPRWPTVYRAVRELTATERRVLVLHYAHGLTLREIGARVRLSESGACRVRSRALAKLREACAA